jgi:hypothetical protein
MQQHNQRFSLDDKEFAIIEHFTDIMKQTLAVQQEILAQVQLLNNRVLTVERNVEMLSRPKQNPKS